jgi:hypothetical protein
MDVMRRIMQRIPSAARRKVATALVRGKAIVHEQKSGRGGMEEDLYTRAKEVGIDSAANHHFGSALFFRTSVPTVFWIRA